MMGAAAFATALLFTFVLVHIHDSLLHQKPAETRAIGSEETAKAERQKTLEDRLGFRGSTLP